MCACQHGPGNLLRLSLCDSRCLPTSPLKTCPCMQLGSTANTGHIDSYSNNLSRGPCIFKPVCQARGARIPVPVENESLTLQTYAAVQSCSNAENLCHTNGTPSAYFALLLNSVTDEFCGDFGSDFSRRNGALLKNEALKVSSLDSSVGCCCPNPICKCSSESQ